MVRIAPVVGYDGYFVTSDGKVIGKHSKRPLKPQITIHGYERVSLVKDGKTINEVVHRLVAKSFIPNPLNLPTVNHKDENKLNNNVDNLEWATVAYQNAYGTKGARTSASQMNRSDCSKPVIMYDKNGNELNRFPSTQEAFRQTGISRSTIAKVCAGIPKYHTAGGYLWKWEAF